MPSSELVDVNAMQASVEAAESAMSAVINYLKEEKRPTSEAAHQIIDQVLFEHGCESPEGHIVAGGPSSYEPHEKGSGAIKSSEPIVIDIFPCSTATGLWADMTRTVCLGPVPEELKRMYDAVQTVYETSVSRLRPGVAGCDLQQFAKDMFVELGYETRGKGTEFPFAEGFVHGLGHGVGFEIHQAPFFNLKSNDILKVGDVVTIEPGLYYENIGGVRLEDMFLITKTGAKRLTTVPIQLSL